MSWVVAMFPEAAQVEIWGGEPQALACAALMPAGLAQRDGEGFRLSGQWHFLSGIDHAAWVFLTTPCDDGMGGRELRNFLVRRAELDVIDDWHVLGLAGTGSKTVKADGVFVPAHRAILYDELLAGTAPGSRVHPHYPLCRTPRRYLTTFSITPVLVGLANRALDVTTDMLRSRLNAGAPPDEFEAVQQKLAECAAEVKMANLILDTGVRESVAAAAAGRSHRRQGRRRQSPDDLLHGATVPAGGRAARRDQRLALHLRQPPDAGHPARHHRRRLASRLQLGAQRPRLQPEHRDRAARRATGRTMTAASKGFR